MTGGVVVLDGPLQVIWAIALGALLTIGLVGWMVGGDVTSLTWIRGAVGEQQTEDVLRALPDSWAVIHDVSDGHGNWDHVVVGPPGVFVIETKNYTSRAVVENDTLRSGNIRTAGGKFRGSAVRLKEVLESDTGRRTWVTPTVVVWGDFPQGVHTERDVVYLAASKLIAWLTARPQRLSPAARQELGEAIARRQNVR